MINEKEIKAEILRLENEETTYPNCSKLAVLYSVEDHLSRKEEKRSEKRTPTENRSAYSFGSSEFLTIAMRAPIDDVLGILDEHLEAIRLLYPREYSAIIEKIKERASK